MESHQCGDQAGFRKDFSTDDHLFTVSQLTEKCREWRKDLWIAVVDFRKAFDTVLHSKLVQMMRAHEIPEAYVAFYMDFYSFL